MRWTNEILYSSCPCRWVTKVWVPRRWPHTSIHNYRGWTVEEPLPRWMASMTRGRQGPSESLSHERIYYLSWNLLPSFLRLEFNFDSLLDTSSSFVVKSHLKRHCCPYGPTTFLPPFLSFSLFSLAHPSSLTWATAWTAPATPPPAPLSRSVPFDDGHSHLSLSHSLSLSLSNNHAHVTPPYPRTTAHVDDRPNPQASHHHFQIPTAHNSYTFPTTSCATSWPPQCTLSPRLGLLASAIAAHARAPPSCRQTLSGHPRHQGKN
jgi:hypothetical protein